MGCEESFLLNPAMERRATPSKARVHTSFLTGRSHKMNNVGQLPTQLTQGVFSITDEDIDMIEDLLLSHHLFFKVKSFTGREIITKLEKFTAEARKTIFSKGDISNYFYIILEGFVRISDITEEAEQRVLERGECFGDFGIQNKACRSGTAETITNVRLLGLRRDHFLRVSLGLSRKAQNNVFKEIKTIQAFSFLSMHQKHKISYLAQQLRFPKGAYIFRKGESSDCLYVVKSGKVCLKVPNKEDIELTWHQTFGESCLKHEKALRSADAICTQVCTLLAFNKHDMIKYLGSSLQEIEISNKVIWALRRQQSLKVSPIIIDAMINSKDVVFFEDEHVVAQKGDQIQYLIVSLEGGINNKGELQLLNCNYLNGIRFQTEDLIKKGDGRVVIISLQQIQSKFNRKFNLLLNIDHMICKEIQSNIIIQQYTKTLTMDKFQVLQVKGEGQYGPTLRIKSDSNIQFALKVFDKFRVIQDSAQNEIFMLRRINLKTAHNLIAKSYRIYSDQHRLYFLNKLVQGQSLCNYLQHHNKVSLHIVRHFSACMIGILEYLHCKRILWREMKIQSFVIDSDGYINLVDLMHLQELNEDEFYIDISPNAALHYLSPETLSGEGYGFESDFWGLGVIIYRMMVGHFPFGQQITKEDHSVFDLLYDQINVSGLELPQWLPPDAKILLKQLLNVNPLERSLISVNRVKQMTFFKDYDWLGLMERKIQNLPYLPKKQAVQTIKSEAGLPTWIGNQLSFQPPDNSLDSIFDI